jgi:GntR family histidine utilization transcriptional repressor
VNAPINNWQAVQQEVLRRIHNKEWQAGELIPSEATLAQEFRCARTTVNRALRAVAEDGLLDRRRRAGTRVALHPVRKATLPIPMIRQEIENRGQRYSYSLLEQHYCAPPTEVKARMRLASASEILYIAALHLADGKPYVFERRWINSSVVAGVAEADFSQQSANEWLLLHTPLSRGDIAFSASLASAQEADVLGVPPSSALFIIERDTWDEANSITSVRLCYAPGYRLYTEI